MVREDRAATPRKDPEMTKTAAFDVDGTLLD
jgi:hypothetical protein